MILESLQKTICPKTTSLRISFDYDQGRLALYWRVIQTSISAQKHSDSYLLPLLLSCPTTVSLSSGPAGPSTFETNEETNALHTLCECDMIQLPS